MNFRPTASLDRRLRAIAARTGLTRTAVLESLADEAERTRRYPGLGFRGSDLSRSAWVIGTGLDVWEIVRAVRDFGDDPKKMAAETEVSERAIRIALAYYREFKDEVDVALSLGDRQIDELQHEYPFAEGLKV